MSGDKSKASFFSNMVEKEDQSLLNKIASGKGSVVSEESNLQDKESDKVDSKEDKDSKKVSDSKSSGSVKESSKAKKALKTYDININDILENGFEEYKENFKMAKNNIRLTEENHNELKKLKATDVPMVHLVNFLIHSMVSNDSFKKYINKNI